MRRAISKEHTRIPTQHTANALRRNHHCCRKVRRIRPEQLKLIYRIMVEKVVSKNAVVPNSAARAVLVRVELEGIAPAIWRRIRTPVTMTLEDLHYALQGAFGWEDCHLHEFSFGKDERYSANSVRIEDIDDYPAKDSKLIKLEQLVARRLKKLTYTYDFGDSWVHQVFLEKVEPSDKPMTLPEVIDGERSAPPEDCGGPWAYQDIQEEFLKPKNERSPEHLEMVDWFPEDFDPVHFDKKRAQQEIRSYFRR